jgi:hypothetical protein
MPNDQRAKVSSSMSDDGDRPVYLAAILAVVAAVVTLCFASSPHIC